MLKDRKITGFTKPVSALADTPKMSAQKLKEWFDSNSTVELKTALNGAIDDLTGAAGADNIGTEYGVLSDVLTYLREKTGSDKEYNEFLSFLARHTAMAKEAYDNYQTEIGGLEESAQLELTNFLAWIEASKIRSSNEMKDWLATIQGILSGDVAGNLLVLIQALEAKQPTQQIGSLTGVAEADGKLADCTLYLAEYACGVGGIGDGPCGGGPLANQPMEIKQNFDGTLEVRTLPQWGGMNEIHGLGGGRYAFCQNTGSQSLLLVVK
ncbi:hypothetical protein [Bittarella massiliensis (ex Durand et al. 2017)]|uniref:hypothetical protein n=1 Tax=Bittarella massiliensis (ex Durand et al. 2017) TaxID=1720313 RepID=UPI001AA12E7A|nr:hypothetical protein [Bittarella massiliensis (ex Durand et al. 2017)]MBO1680418.1 hypothetical protein [Bittarella massiliensis (ex Durand et al. 2017)]